MAILLTGITGLLGRALVKQNKGIRKIKGMYLGSYEMPDTEFVTYIRCDVTDKDTLFKLAGNDTIECIIHAAGIANVDICERKPKLAYASNVTGTKNIIELARSKKAKLVYISTNAVFDGKNPPYNEEDEPNPINQYGRIKLECEMRVRECSKDSLIARLILMYGVNNPNERKSFFTWVLESLKSKKRINVVNDVYENPILSDECADIIWKLIDKNTAGIYHIGGRTRLSRYEGASIAAKVFSLDGSLINPVPSAFFSDIAPRPKDTSYNTKKIEKELKIKPLGFEEGLLSFVKK